MTNLSKVLLYITAHVKEQFEPGFADNITAHLNEQFEQGFMVYHSTLNEQFEQGFTVYHSSFK